MIYRNKSYRLVPKACQMTLPDWLRFCAFMRLFTCDCVAERLPLIVLQACRLCEMVDFHLYSGSCSSVPSSAVICRRREVCAYIIGLALKSGLASKGVQLIAELNAVL